MRILSIDPGLHHCGFSVLELDQNGVPLVIHSETMDSDSHIKHLKYVSELHGERLARLSALSDYLLGLLTQYKPHVVCSEIPFWNPGRPGAFEVLVAVVTTLNNVVFSYDKSIIFERIPAAQVKKNLQVSGSSSDKDLIKKALIEKEIKFVGVSLETLGPDAIDSIAVGLHMCETFNRLG
jgi:Holliday junction resolvasome RuvABC endonuclease subunit